MARSVCLSQLCCKSQRPKIQRGPTVGAVRLHLNRIPLRSENRSHLDGEERRGAFPGVGL